MSSGSVTISSRWAAWLGGAALAALSGGAAAALGTYRGVAELRVEVRQLSGRVEAIESRDHHSARAADVASIEARLRGVEQGLGRVQATLEMLVERRR